MQEASDLYSVLHNLESAGSEVFQSGQFFALSGCWFFALAACLGRTCESTTSRLGCGLDLLFVRSHEGRSLEFFSPEFSHRVCGIDQEILSVEAVPPPP